MSRSFAASSSAWVWMISSSWRHLPFQLSDSGLDLCQIPVQLLHIALQIIFLLLQILLHLLEIAKSVLKALFLLFYLGNLFLFLPDTVHGGIGRARSSACRPGPAPSRTAPLSSNPQSRRCAMLYSVLIFISFLLHMQMLSHSRQCFPGNRFLCLTSKDTGRKYA